jgi:hypothetical protein
MGPRAIEAFRQGPVQHASRPAPAASRLQFAPPAGPLAWIRKRLLYFPVALDELDPCQIRPSRQREVLPGGLAPKHLPQQLMEAPVVPLAKEALPLRVLGNRQFPATATATNRVRGPFAPNGPCFRHGRSTSWILCRFRRVVHQNLPEN